MRNVHSIARVLLPILAVALRAQTPVAPTNEPVGIPRGENEADYNIRQSFEVGYRWHTVGGDLGMYRSTVNYGNGPRLLASSLSVNSLEGHGGLFDQIQVNTLGLGNDPYESATLRLEKNRFYRYDFSWRSDAYYNPALPIVFGEHFIDTVRHNQDQDLTLFPQGNFKLFLGFSSVSQTGPALTTIQEFNSTGDEFPLFENIQRFQYEYRLGGEIRVKGIRLNVLHAWVDFKDDTPVSLISPSPGNNPSDLTSVTSLNRSEPYHGTSPYWRVALFREKKLWALNGRFTYVAGHRGFVQDETSLGFDRLGTPTTQQVFTAGNAERPALATDLTFSVFPSSILTLTNQTAFSNIRMVGNSFFTQLTNGIPARPFSPFTYLGIRMIANSSDADLRVNKWLSLRAGYEYSTRQIRSIEGADVANVPTPPLAHVPIQQDNGLQTFLAGVRLRPLKGLSVLLDTDIGLASRPIYPVSQRNYKTYRGRAEYKLGRYRVSAYARTDYNTNSVSLANFASHSRQFGVDGSWALRNWLSIDAGFGKLHLDTLGAINFFTQGTTVGPLQQVTTDLSYFISNIYTGNLAARFTLLQRVDVSLGYSQVQDVGDGRPVAATVSPGFSPITPPAFFAAQTFPLRYLSPQARISVRLREKVRWNLGYQGYGYHEDFSALQNYRAQTGYTSVLWSF
jgi:hypothetical protein